MTSISFPNDSYVSVFPFTRQEGAEDVVIGRADTNSFLALDRETVQILDDLAQGKSVGEARELYLQRHGEEPDLEEFLQLLSRRGFVHSRREGETPAEIPAQLPAIRTHFDGIPVWVARLLFGRGALVLYATLIGAATLAVGLDPALFPGRRALYFEHHHTPKILGLALFSFVTLFFHEMSHLLAARAAGIKARIGIGNRLWIVVAETDLTGLWAKPARARYLPLVAGPLIDLLSGSLIILLLAAERAGIVSLSPLSLELARALFYAYLFQFSWQFFFFVRTDFYYVLAVAFDCKNLLGDTETSLRNRVAPLLRRLPQWRFLPACQIEDQSHISRREQRLIRVYSWIWLFGRIVALTLLFTIGLPVTWAYVVKIHHALTAGYAADAAAFVDSLLLLVFSLSLWALGMGMWLNQWRQSWKKH